MSHPDDRSGCAPQRQETKSTNDGVSTLGYIARLERERDELREQIVRERGEAYAIALQEQEKLRSYAGEAFANGFRTARSAASLIVVDYTDGDSPFDGTLARIAEEIDRLVPEVTERHAGSPAPTACVPEITRDPNRARPECPMGPQPCHNPACRDRCNMLDTDESATLRVRHWSRETPDTVAIRFSRELNDADIRDFPRALLDALESRTQSGTKSPEGWRVAPFEPTEDQWGELARDILMWMQLTFKDGHTAETLRYHLNAVGREIPEWLHDELRDKGHLPKGTVVTLIYKAMLEAAPEHTENQVNRQSNGAEAIAAERSRQMQVEKWNPEHDDDHDNGSLAGAAAGYALVAREQALGDTGPFMVPDWWAWDDSWWKPKDQRRNLVRAGALIAAEIDRIDRAEKLRTVAGTKQG